MYQVLSETVGCALMETGKQEYMETSKFVSIFDKFFDMLNVSNFTNGTRKRKRFLHPYRHEHDFRLAVSSNSTTDHVTSFVE
jgi:hypothetical protein